MGRGAQARRGGVCEPLKSQSSSDLSHVGQVGYADLQEEESRADNSCKSSLGIDLSEEPSWPPNRRRKDPMILPGDGRLDAPRRNHTLVRKNDNFSALAALVSRPDDTDEEAHVNRQIYTRSSMGDVLDRLTTKTSGVARDDTKAGNRKGESSPLRIHEGHQNTRLVLCPDGGVVPMAPHVNMHGGFNAQSVHPILAIRYRWRHATSKALAVTNERESSSIRAHRMFVVIAKTAGMLGVVRKARETAGPPSPTRKVFDDSARPGSQLRALVLGNGPLSPRSPTSPSARGGDRFVRKNLTWGEDRTAPVPNGPTGRHEYRGGPNSRRGIRSRDVSSPLARASRGVLLATTRDSEFASPVARSLPGKPGGWEALRKETGSLSASMPIIRHSTRQWTSQTIKAVR